MNETIPEKETSTFYICCYNDRGELAHTKVSKAIYYYVRQLESYIENPKDSKLKEMYPNKFRL